MFMNTRTSLAGLVPAIVAFAAADAYATTRTVTSLADSGAGTLRNTIAASAANDTIGFSVTGTITLTSGELLIGRNLTILGSGTSMLTVSGNDASRVFNILTNVTVNISMLTISHGRVQGTNSPPGVTGGPGLGAGVYNAGTLLLNACTLTANSAIGGDQSSSSGIGGSGFGGGVYNANGSTLWLTNCTLSGNSASGGGGGSSAYSGGAGSGGSIYNQGTLALTACTLSSNTATGGPGGVGTFGYGGNGGNGIGGGLAQIAGGVTIRNTIIAGNSAAGGIGGSGDVENGAPGTGTGPDVSGTATSPGYNLIGKSDGSSGWVPSDQTGSSAAPLDPALGPLADNGGPTRTMALLSGSAAIDRGNSFGLTTDQLGQPRPFENSNIPNAADGSDIGAYENQTATGSGSTVLNTNDNGTGSLRQVIAMAASGDTITFGPNVTNTITLTSGELVIGRNLTIVGPGTRMLAVSGNNARRVFNITAGSVNISGLTISNGLAAGTTGLFNAGPGSPGFGGGIHNAGTLVLTGCTVSGNSATGGMGGENGETAGGGPGGAGSGGGVYNQGTLTLVACTLSGNSARGGTGGLADDLNSIGGAGGSGSGGGVYNAGTLALTACTLSSNTVTGGLGGDSGFGTGGNGGNGRGGGLAQTAGSVTVGNTIIAGNSANGGGGGSGGNAGNSGTGIGPDVFGTVTSSGYNLVGRTDGSSGWVASDLTGTIATPLNPLLGPLADNGGPTRTIAPLAGSAAIDAGNSFGLTSDQRGRLRPFDNPNVANAAGGDGSDIGAYEISPVVVVVATTNDSGAGSLRQAIAMAAAGDTIVFEPGVTNTITLTSGELLINRNLSIAGPGANVLTVSGNSTSRVFVVTGGPVNISGLTIANGIGGISNNATLSVTACAISGHSGSGIFNGSSGVLTLNDCTISSNTITSSSGSIFGAGIDNSAASSVLRMTNCTATGNRLLQTSIFLWQVMGGGLRNSGTATLLSCTICSNACGSLSDTLVFGGGIANYGPSPTLTLGNTIVAGNISTNIEEELAPDCSGAFTSLGYNLVGKTNGGSGWVATDQTGSMATPLNPLLGPLQNNGGTTFTHALLVGSPAMDKGKSFGLTTDQRGRVRPYDDATIANASGGDGSDIGAFEKGAPIQEWKLTQLGDANAPDLGDPDGDSLSNLLEYALVLSPTTPSVAPSAALFTYAEGMRLRLFFTRDPARNDVTIEVQAAASPAGPWTTIASSVLGGVTSGAGYVGGDSAGPGLKTVEVRDTVNLADAPERFLRVRVSH